jgi:hypothetical protein
MLEFIGVKTSGGQFFSLASFFCQKGKFKIQKLKDELIWGGGGFNSQKGGKKE